MKKIDKKDKRLLFELFKDGRASISELASRIGLSKESAGYRLKRLESSGLLQKVVPIIDFSAIGYSLYRVQILLTPEGKNMKSELEKQFRAFGNIGWIVELSGNWDYALLFSYEDNYKFFKGYAKFISKFGKYIDKKISSIVFSIMHLPETYLYGGERLFILQEIKENSFDLDDNQKKILDLLQEDGRMSYLELARKLTVSATTIKYHLQLLEKKKIILGYKPVLNTALLGYEHFKVNLELADPSQNAMVKELLRVNKNTIYITEAWGKFDIEFECEYSNVNDLLSQLDEIEKQVHIRKYDIIFTNKEKVISEVPDVRK